MTQYGIQVKMNSLDTTTSADIHADMLKDLSGVNSWKAFGDTLWFFKQAGYDKFGNVLDDDEDEDEDEDEDDEDDEDEDEEEEDEWTYIPKVQPSPIKRKLRV
jgi:Ran GTPase-activating protein (RanGAP) involved in mRNA processing and transport